MKNCCKKQSKIVFLGMPGSGKSTYGTAYAKKFNMLFFDLDDLIETKVQSSISDYILSQGIKTFREVESVSLKNFLEQFSKKKDWVLSLGGGTPCFFNHIDLINQYAYSVYLSVELNTLFDRLVSDNQLVKRPLLKNKIKMEQEIKKLYSQRLPYYQKAHLTIENPSLSKISQL